MTRHPANLRYRAGSNTNDMPVRYPNPKTKTDNTPECFIILRLNCYNH